MKNKLGKNDILSILNDWNVWRKDLETGIIRTTYFEKIQAFNQDNHIIVVTGARRSGKSFIMRQYIKELITRGVSKEETVMINFEDPRWGMLTVQDIDRVYETYVEYLKPKGKPYVFLDEVQEVEGWERWVRKTHELAQADLILSGSNAKLLSKELSTLLTGRHVDVTVFPLSFKEFLDFQGIDATDMLDIADQRIAIQRLCMEYIQFGSFPEVVLGKNKKEILFHYFDDVVSKDILKRYKIRKPEQLKSLVKFYLSNTSSLTTFSSTEKFLAFSADTIEKFAGYLETAYLFFFLKRFSFKIKEQEKSPRKVYCIDSGLAHAVSFRFSENRGQRAENIVFLELLRRGSGSREELYYWKDAQHREVDFVVKEGERIIELIQVCWELQEIRTKERELRSLIKASNELACKTLLVITGEYEGEEEVEGKDIRYVPLWKWLLA
ncbi:MAG: ATP-binding protein [Candidatus Jacksonbacteria bacterium]|nr:ATP-binding protein [Candidatus Jacksonbacteria bacterium]